MSGTRVPVGADDLEQHLREQIEFLESSAAGFDAGTVSEAKRLAARLRVLLHDKGRNSHSLLGQLGLKSGNFLSSGNPPMEGTQGGHCGLASVPLSGPKKGTFQPLLDEAGPRVWKPFEEWWGEVVIIDREGAELTREDLVLIAANQDGGAHVDPSVDQRYSDLTKKNSVGMLSIANGKSVPIIHAERAALRQIAHEVLVTVCPGYTKAPELGDTVLMGAGVRLVYEGEEPPADKLPAPTPIPGRNDPCLCGRGRKYKKCHGLSGVPS